MNPEELFRGESETIEYKASVAPRSEAYMKTVIAFANGRGGQLLFGVQDVSGEALGLGRKTVFKYMDAVANAIASKCEPRIHPHIYLYEIDRKPIIIVDVPPGAETPYWIQGEGIENGTYVRVGATTRKADRYRIEELILRGQHKFFDQELTDVVIKEAKARAFCEDMYEYVRTKNPMDSEDQRRVGIGQMLSWGMLHEADHHFYASNGYLLMDGPSEKFQETGIQCAVYKGTRRGTVVTRSEYDGRFYDNIECAVNFISAHLMDRDSNGELYERSRLAALPQRSIREIVVNAVCHRSYQTPGKIQIGIFDDKVEVVSPGGLDCSLAVEDILCGRSRVRNPAIAGALRYTGMFEGWGNGIPQVMADAAANDLPAPIFRARPGDFVVRLNATDEENEDAEEASESVIPIIDAVRIPVVALSEPSDSEVGTEAGRADEYEFVPYDAFGSAKNLLSFDDAEVQEAVPADDVWQRDVKMADEVSAVLTGALKHAEKAAEDGGEQSGAARQRKEADRVPARAAAASARQAEEQKKTQQAGKSSRQGQDAQTAKVQKQNGPRQSGQQGKSARRQEQNGQSRQNEAQGAARGQQSQSTTNQKSAQPQGKDGQKQQNGQERTRDASQRSRQKAQQDQDHGKRNAQSGKPAHTEQNAAGQKQQSGGKSDDHSGAVRAVRETQKNSSKAGQSGASEPAVAEAGRDGQNGGGSKRNRRSRRSRKRAQERAAELEAMLDSELEEEAERKEEAEEPAAMAPERKRPATPAIPPSPAWLTDLPSAQALVYVLLREEPTLTQSALHERTMLSLTTVRRALDALQEKNLLRREGGRRYGAWIVQEPS